MKLLGFLLERYMCVAIATNEAARCFDAGELFRCRGEEKTARAAAEFFAVLF